MVEAEWVSDKYELASIAVNEVSIERNNASILTLVMGH